MPSLITDASKKELRLTTTDIWKEDFFPARLKWKFLLYFSICLLSRGHKTPCLFFSQKNPSTRQLSLMVHEKDVAGTWKGKFIYHRTWATLNDLTNVVWGKTRCCSNTALQDFHQGLISSRIQYCIGLYLYWDQESNRIHNAQLHCLSHAQYPLGVFFVLHLFS